jgi:hypothetical protein
MPLPTCLDASSESESSDDEERRRKNEAEGGAGLQPVRVPYSKKCLRRMGKRSLRRLAEWLLEVEMGFVWGVAGLSIIIFVFAAIWYIDPALLTLVLRFRQARCSTYNSAFLVGISNCSWTSCRLGCTREIFKCWQIQVNLNLHTTTYTHHAEGLVKPKSP